MKKIIKDNFLLVYLKGVLGLLCVPVFIYLILVSYSMITGDMGEEGISWAIYFIAIGYCIATLPYIYAIINSYLLLRQYEKGKLYSENSVIILSKITVSSIIVGVLILIVEVPVFAIANYDDAPGLILFNLFIAGLVFGVTAFSTLIAKIISDKL